MEAKLVTVLLFSAWYSVTEKGITDPCIKIIHKHGASRDSFCRKYLTKSQYSGTV